MYNTLEKKPKSPKTGDKTDLTVPVVVFATSVATILAALYMRKRLQK